MFIQENEEEKGAIGIELSAIPKTINVSCLTMPAQDSHASNNAVKNKTNEESSSSSVMYMHDQIN